MLMLGLALELAAAGAPAAPASQASPSICAIQGKAFTSPYLGRTVRTRGVVFADFDATSQRRFFIQDEACDHDSTTSDGLTISLSEPGDVVQIGDLVQVSGLVQEVYGQTQLLAAAVDVQIVARGQALPAAQELDPPQDETQAARYLEARESMAARVSAARVVGPTNPRGWAWLVNSASGLERIWAGDASAAAARVCVDDRGVLNFPAAAAGDLAFNVSGVLETILGSYCLALTTPPQLEAPSRPSPWPAPTGLPRLLTWNLHDLFDTIDDPATEDDVPSAPAYQRALSKHAQALAALGGSAKIALVGVQEVENGRALQDLLARPELTPGYRFVMFDGPDQRGLDVALVYDPAQVQIISAVSHQACTALQDGLGPDGNGDPLNPIMTPTCDLNSSGLLNGSRLFSRPPLAVHVRLALPAAGRPVWQPLWIVVVHLKSHLEDTFQQPYTQARRAEQARLLSQLSAALQSQSPGEPLAVIGDFNDDPSAPALEALRQSGLLPLSAQLAPAQRYTYLYEGVSYMYDNSYVNTPAMLVWGVPQAVHFNADFPSDLEGQAGAPWRASDHDPLVVEIAALQSRMWLPLIITQP